MPASVPDVDRLLIRPITPGDRSALATAHALLSDETVRRRFLAPKPRLAGRELTYLTEVDGVDHVALVAVAPEAPERILAVARFVRWPDDPQMAEAAIVVGDPLQGQGLGRRLGLALADAARERGIMRFSATLLSDNAAAHALFAAISRRLRSSHAHGVEELIADLAA